MSGPVKFYPKRSCVRYRVVFFLAQSFHWHKAAVFCQTTCGASSDVVAVSARWTSLVSSLVLEVPERARRRRNKDRFSDECSSLAIASSTIVSPNRGGQSSLFVSPAVCHPPGRRQETVSFGAGPRASSHRTWRSTNMAFYSPVHICSPNHASAGVRGSRFAGVPSAAGPEGLRYARHSAFVCRLPKWLQKLVVAGHE